MSEANVKRAKCEHASGRRHNKGGFSNRMLDTTMALMAAR
jgi:hypothetical protein